MTKSSGVKSNPEGIETKELQHFRCSRTANTRIAFVHQFFIKWDWLSILHSKKYMPNGRAMSEKYGMVKPKLRESPSQFFEIQKMQSRDGQLDEDDENCFSFRHFQ